jgi:large subunit ribosomal protein L1
LVDDKFYKWGFRFVFTTGVGGVADIITSVGCMEIKKALEELRKGKKRKFDQTLDLVVNLKNFDVRKEALNTFVSVPHGRERRLAGFLMKRSKLIDSITEADFVKYKDLKDIKKLAKKYDGFIAIAPMMSKIATTFGRVFGPMGRMPSPQAGIVPKDDDATIKMMIEKMNKSIRVKNKEMAIKLGVGKESMNDDVLVENVDAVLKGLEKVLPRGRDNIKEVLVKFTMTKPIAIMEVKKQ